MFLLCFSMEAEMQHEKQKMKLAKVECDMSHAALANKVGVTRQTIELIEAGNYNPSLNLCIAICRALGKDRNELFWEEY